jgi:hypothetical protein
VRCGAGSSFNGRQSLRGRSPNEIYRRGRQNRSKGFGEISVELDANQLRQIVRDAIERHLPPDQFAVLQAVEVSECEILRSFVDNLSGGAS